MNTLYTHRGNRNLLRSLGSFGLLLWVGLSPVLAQRQPAQADTALAKAGTTTTVRIEAETQFTEGIRYLMTDEPAKAITQFEKLLQKQPSNAAAHYSLANALVKSGKLNDAVAHAAKAHNLSADNKYYSLLLAELYVKQKRYAEAEALYEAILKKGPENAEYGVELAAIYLFDEKPDQALNAYNLVERELGTNEEITRQKQRIYL